MRRIATALIAAFVALSSALADEAHHRQVPLSEGEIRKVDVNAKKLTIKHGPLLNLDMPAMTMVFRVKEAKMLESLKAGDKIRFRAEKLDSAYTVTRIEPAR